MTEYLETPHGRLAYDVRGHGPLIVAVPGMGEIRQTYRFVTERLVGNGYRVATMDLRGHGESDTTWPSYTQRDLGDDVLRLVDHLGGPAVLIGTSFTPDSVRYAAAEAPDAVVATILIAPFPGAPELGWFMRAAQAAVVRIPRLWAWFYRSLYPGVKPADFNEHVTRLLQSLRRTDGMVGLRSMTRPEYRDAVDDRSRATQPALVLMGSKDPDFPDPAAAAAATAAVLSGDVIETIMMEGAGHYPQAQFPDETATAIIDFLNRIGVPGDA